MISRFAPRLLCVALFASSTILASAQAYPLAPVPHAIHTAHTVFVSNAGADAGLFPEPFSGNPNRAYAQLYAALKSKSPYQLVDDPAKADLVLELSLTAPNGPSRGSKQLGASDPVPMFRLVVYDRPTHYILWTETQSIEMALLQKTHDRNFDAALDALFARLLQVAAEPPAVQ